MDLTIEIDKEFSKNKAVKLAEYVGNDPVKFKELANLFFQKNPRTSQRAASVVSMCVDNYPSLIIPYINTFIRYLDKPEHNGIKRNCFRILQLIDVPDEFLGIVADAAFKFFTSKSEPIAVKVFSMTVLYNISLKEPELKRELKILIEDQFPYSSPGFKSRAKKILKNLGE